MKIHLSDLSQAWTFFTDERLSEDELLRLGKSVDSWKDFTAFLMINTDFLDTHPYIDEIIAQLSPPVSRNLLDKSDPALFEKFISKCTQDIVAKKAASFFKKQIEYANRLTELTELEIDILELRSSIEQKQPISLQ